MRWTRAALGAVAFWCWAGGAAFAAGTGCDAVQPVPQALRTVLPPGAAAHSETVGLPDRLLPAQRGENYRIAYRIDVAACAGSASAGLWLFRAGAPYSVSGDDGQPLALLSARSLNKAAARPNIYNGRIPALFALPPGTRSVRLELHPMPYLPSGLVEVRTGPVAQLLQLQAATVEDVVAHADAASGVVLVLGLLAWLLWLQRRRDRTLLWLAVACGLWGVRGLVYFGHAVYGPPLAYEQFPPLNVQFAAAALAASVMSLLGGMTRRQAWAIGGATLLCIGVVVGTYAVGTGGAVARLLSMGSAFVLVCWLTWQVVRRRARLPGWRAGTLAGSMLLMQACGAHDLLVVAGVLPPDRHSYTFWGFVLLLVGYAALAGQYVVLTLNRAERSNEELERHVAHKTLELEHSYALLRDREREAARVQERERLLRDMHDGLGAQLMTTLRGVERGALRQADVARSLQDGLDELRLLMDSTDIGQYLPAALAAWRNRWDSRLEAAGVTLKWHIDETLDEVRLAGDTALQLMRILQEAATNVVKHAGARHMALHAGVAAEPGGGGTLRIEIADDGVGLPAHEARPGARGLKNMRYRAGQIGARVDIDSPAPGAGTRVVVLLPL
ncbi:MAG: ATP-binding protein [Pseudomonadota bacterium]